jgi:hypothetical protein
MERPWQIALGAAGLVVVAVLAFLIGQSTRPYRQAVSPTPQTGGPVPQTPVKRPPRRVAPGPKTGPTQPTPKTTPTQPTPPGGQVPWLKGPVPVPTPPKDTKPAPEQLEVYRDAELGVSIEKPRGAEWVLAPGKGGLLAHPNKVIEIRRTPQDGSQRFGHIDVYVCEVPPAMTPDAVAEDLEKHKGINRWAETATFAVLDERTVQVGGRSMVRRVLRVQDRGHDMRLLTLRGTQRRKLFMLIAHSDADQFDALVPEFEQAIHSLRLD